MRYPYHHLRATTGRTGKLTWLLGLHTHTVVGGLLCSQVEPHASAVGVFDGERPDGIGFGSASRFCARAQWLVSTRITLRQFYIPKTALPCPNADRGTVTQYRQKKHVGAGGRCARF